jgi:IS30 family transposase
MLNERPRKILNWKSPAQCFQELLILNKCSS